MPLLGLLVAFLVAFFVGIRICPTISALVLPPEPRLPNGRVTQLKHENKGTGLDEYVYGTNIGGCEVALFYQNWLQDCTYDPDVHCANGKETSRIVPENSAYHVVQCMGRQSVGVYTLAWTVYVSTGYGKENDTVFRLVREVSN